MISIRVMLNHIQFLVWLLFVQRLSAQNLVPNADFEEIIQNPLCKYADPGDNIGQYLAHWSTPTGGSTDIWSSNFSSNCQLNPLYYNAELHSGQYNVGLFTTNVAVKANQYREYVEVKLKQPLSPGKVYYAEMYVRLMTVSGMASNNLGMYFTRDSLSQQEQLPSIGKPFLVTPQVNESDLLSSSTTWYKVSGCFQATDSYFYLTIGNFFDDKHTVVQDVAFPTGISDKPPRYGAYYLVDDVFVGEAGTDRLSPLVDLGHDTTLCANQQLHIQLTDTMAVRYSWQDKMIGANYSIKQAGTFIVTAINGKCEVTDTLRVLVEPAIVLPADTVLCQGEVLTLVAHHPSQKFIWSDGTQDSTLRVDQAGVYSVRVPSAYCNIADTIQVTSLVCPGMVPNVFTPNGDGKNDVFFIQDIERSTWQLEVFNRWGRKVYHNDSYQNDWQGGAVPAGLYYYSLTNKQLLRNMNGWLEIIR